MVGIYREVTGFWAKFSNFFKDKKKTPKSVAKKTKYVAYTETQATADIVKHLTEFWTLQDQLNEYLHAEEEKAKVYNPNISNAEMMASAMNRVLCQQQMEKLAAEIREIMVYQTVGLADIYTKTYAMREEIQEQQTKARLAKQAKERQTRWLQRQSQRNLQASLAAVLATSIFLLYLWMWLYLINRWQKV